MFAMDSGNWPERRRELIVLSLATTALPKAFEMPAFRIAARILFGENTDALVVSRKIGGFRFTRERVLRKRSVWGETA
jgi:fructose 1,6-bisphosphatase